jgi:hypothetical protein
MTSMARPINWDFLAFLAKAIGLLLVFVGSIVGVVGLNPSTSPNINTIDGAILVTRLLWTLGLAAVATGAGIKLRFVIGMPMGELQDGPSRVLRGAQWRNTLTFLVALVLLLWILTFLPV